MRAARLKSRQLGLDLPFEPQFQREDFLAAPSNEIALDMVERWPDWPDRYVLLIGPAGAGKSHLGAIWAAASGATVIAAADLTRTPLPDLAARGPVLVEDADAGPVPERELFHLFNLVREAESWLMITASTPLAEWNVSTRDLLSRLRLAQRIELAAPDDALIRAVLVKLFHDRQLEVDASVVAYLALRIERSLDAARAIVDLLDRESIAQGRPVTRRLAAEVYQRLDDVIE